MLYHHPRRNSGGRYYLRSLEGVVLMSQITKARTIQLRLAFQTGRKDAEEGREYNDAFYSNSPAKKEAYRRGYVSVESRLF